MIPSESPTIVQTFKNKIELKLINQKRVKVTYTNLHISNWLSCQGANKASSKTCQMNIKHIGKKCLDPCRSFVTFDHEQQTNRL